MERIIIVGGGFSGLLLASRIPDSEVFEENPEIGLPPHCTGIVSRDTIGIIGSPARESIVSSYEYIRVLNSEGKDLVMLKPDQRIYKLDRILLERLLAKEAGDRGSKIYTKARVISIDLEGRAIVSEKGGLRRVEGSLIALAEGSLGTMSRKFGLSRKHDLFLGVQGYIAIKGVHESEILVFIDDRIFRGFFAWLVPIDGREALVGVATDLKSDAQRSIKLFLARLRKLGYLRDDILRRIYGGLIIRSYPLARHYRGRVISIGDAAGFVKPFSGGGIYPASRQAESLSISLRKSRWEDHEGYLKRYLEIIRKEIGSLKNQWIATKVLEIIGIEKAIKVLGDLGVRTILLDYDHHENTIAKTAKKILRLKDDREKS
jgi:flavin-dependent dehydrogenase